MKMCGLSAETEKGTKGLSFVQTDATALNMVGPTILGVVASVLGLTEPRGKDITHKTHAKWACVAPTMLEEPMEKLYIQIQHCCTMLRRSRNKRHIGSC